MKRRWVGILLALALAAVMLGNRGFRRVVSGAIELRRLRHELARLQKEESSLASRIQQSKTNEQVLESAARRELGYRKPGEVEYRFAPPETKGSVSRP